MVGMLDQILGFGGLPESAGFPVVPQAMDPEVEELLKRQGRRWNSTRDRVMSPPLREGSAIPAIGLLNQPEFNGGAWGMPQSAPAPAAEVPSRPMADANPYPESGLNDPFAAEPQVFKGGVPLPRSRPAEAPGGPATDFSGVTRDESGGAPLSLAPPAAAAPAQAEKPGMLSTMFSNLMKPEAAPLLLSLASGFAGAPSIGTGMRRAFGAAAPAAAMMRKEQTGQMSQAETYRALLARGVPAAEAMAAIRSPEILKATVDKYFGTKQAQIVNNRLVREQPDGSVKLLADYSDEATPKNPVIQEFKTPQGEVKKQWNVKTGQWDDIPGFEKPVATRDQKLSVSDVTKMGEKGSKMSQIRGFNDTFKPGYAGYGTEFIGDLANTWARNLPAGQAARERASWWQDYQAHKNTVRHEMFGSALTATEANEFVKADIHPGMQPEVIERNLKRQREIVEKGIRRSADALVEAGYNKSAVYKAYGLDDAASDGSLGVGASTTIDGVKIKRVK